MRRNDIKKRLMQFTFLTTLLISLTCKLVPSTSQVLLSTSYDQMSFIIHKWRNKMKIWWILTTNKITYCRINCSFFCATARPNILNDFRTKQLVRPARDILDFCMLLYLNSLNLLAHSREDIFLQAIKLIEATPCATFYKTHKNTTNTLETKFLIAIEYQNLKNNWNALKEWNSCSRWMKSYD